MKRKLILFIAILSISEISYAQTDIPDAGVNGPMGGGSWLRLATGGTPTSLLENWGINISGSTNQPVKIRNTSLLVGYTTSGENYGQGNLLVSSNVGFGTTDPQYNLDVRGSTGFRNNVYLYASNNGGESNADSPNLFFQGTNYAGAAVISAPREQSYGRRGLAISTHSDVSNDRRLVERFRITYLGNVGIGTSSPQAKLHIQDGSVLIKTLRTGNNSEYALISGTQHVNGASGYAGVWLFEDGGGGFGQASGLSFKTSVNDVQPVTNMIIRGNGNVGIGTTSPDQKLSVAGIIHSQGVKVDMTGWNDDVFGKAYKLQSLKSVANFVNRNRHLPEIPTEAEVLKNGIDVGEMNAKLLKKVEELTLYLINQDKEITRQKVVNNNQLTEIKKIKRQVETLLIAGPKNK